MIIAPAIDLYRTVQHSGCVKYRMHGRNRKSKKGHETLRRYPVGVYTAKVACMERGGCTQFSPPFAYQLFSSIAPTVSNRDSAWGTVHASSTCAAPLCIRPDDRSDNGTWPLGRCSRRRWHWRRLVADRMCTLRMAAGRYSPAGQQ